MKKCRLSKLSKPKLRNGMHQKLTKNWEWTKLLKVRTLSLILDITQKITKNYQQITHDLDLKNILSKLRNCRLCKYNCRIIKLK